MQNWVSSNLNNMKQKYSVYDGLLYYTLLIDVTHSVTQAGYLFCTPTHLVCLWQIIICLCFSSICDVVIHECPTSFVQLELQKCIGFVYFDNLETEKFRTRNDTTSAFHATHVSRAAADELKYDGQTGGQT